MNTSIHLTCGQNSHSKLRQIDKKAVEFTKLMLDELAFHPKITIVEKFDAGKAKVDCRSEDGKLKSVVMSPPTYLDWAGSGINKNEELFKDNKPDRYKAAVQHFGLIMKLVERGISVTIIKPGKDMLEGVFTRDIMFAIDGKIYFSNLKKKERQPEEKSIVGGVKPESEVTIEGGNVVLSKDVVFLGIGDRTTPNAAEWLRGQVGSARKVIPIVLKPGILHLDCAFCPLEERNGKPGAALIYPQAFENAADIALLNRMYGKIEAVGESEYEMLGPNVLKLDKGTSIANQEAKGIAQMLKKFGIDVITHNYGEIIKAGGAYRCTYAAVEREN
ncbi:MAG: arginine deiminase family protein [Candidatus Micrarchaeota archaeon]|nr:arginine deiminase family protein [Candidatus Micrarchaeota archaeon]